MKKLFLIIGAPGSGKTTDASIIAQKNPNIVHYSAGDMLRKEVASGSELGKVIDAHISKGLLVPLPIIINTMDSAISNAPVDTILIDGYPRSVEQMTEFHGLITNNPDIDLRSVIEVRVSEEVARERILGRRAEAAPDEVRSDDNEAVFNDRMKVYTDPLADIQAFYDERDLLEVINGARTLEEVVQDMEKLIESKL